jgi:hypothetical protein
VVFLDLKFGLRKVVGGGMTKLMVAAIKTFV